MYTSVQENERGWLYGDGVKLEVQKIKNEYEPWSDEQTKHNLIGFLRSLSATELPFEHLKTYVDCLDRN